MSEIISVQSWILLLETIMLLIADKKRVLFYFLLALFSVIVFYFL